MKKLVLVGAGSAMFTRGLVADLITSGHPWQLGLVDIDPEALATAEGLTRRMVAAREAAISVEASTDRRDVLPGADVVVTTVGVGGRRAWELDVFIPRQYGVFQPVGDTVMPGGISRALRMVPAMVDIARDVVRLCPRARFFNYSNPMTVNCWAIRRATGAEVVGLCHGVMHTERDLARFAGVPPQEVTSTAVGVNHLTWILDLRWKGRDLWPLVRARLAESRGQDVDYSGLRQAFPELAERHDSPAPELANPFSWDLFATYGAYPAVHDRHVAEFFPERFPAGRYYGKQLGVDAFSFEGTIARGDEVYGRMQAQAAGKAPLDEDLFGRGPGEHEQLLDILASQERDERRLFSANLPNRGVVPNLPAEAVVEIPAVAAATGFRPVQVNDFPPALAALMTRKLASPALTVEAALTGDRRLFLEALLADGAIADPQTACKLADELLAAHKQYLPQFA